jgi:hypothetical protein
MARRVHAHRHVTFQDLTYQDLTPVTATLASNVPLEGTATRR